MSRVLPWLLPAYLFACLLAGGSAQAVAANLLLQLGAIALLAWALLDRAKPFARAGRYLLLLAVMAVLLPLLQIVPLPAALWSALPGRQPIGDGFALLGQPLPWLSWSMAPFATFAAIFPMLVPIGVFAATLRSRERPTRIVVALLAATLAGCLLGILQVSGDGSRYYLYRFSAFGQAAGFFANSNHMATLLLASLPFLAALAVDRAESARDRNRRIAIFVLAGAYAAIVLVAIALNGSLAIQSLSVPALLATIVMVTRSGGARRLRMGKLALITVLVAALIGGALVGPQIVAANRESIESRETIWSTTAEAIGATRLTGTGLGSFHDVYPTYENPDAVNSVYVNAAHNDYLQLALEGGVAGLILAALLLAWWIGAARAIWRDPQVHLQARAATIASAVILLHSLIDYPLRTAGIAALFAFTLAVMVLRPSRRATRETNALRPSRHRIIA